MNEQARPKAIARRITRPRKATTHTAQFAVSAVLFAHPPKRPYRQRERRG